MEPNIWGPPAWLFLHSITFQYPETPTFADKENYRVFFEKIQYVLPCPTCRAHYTENVNRNPIRLNSRKELIEWLIDIHNEVNKKNGKKVLQYDEVYKQYNEIYEYEDVSNKTNFNIGLAFIIILLIVVICYYKYN